MAETKLDIGTKAPAPDRSVQDPAFSAGQLVPAINSDSITPNDTELVVENQAAEPGRTNSEVNPEGAIAVSEASPTGTQLEQAQEDVLQRQQDAIDTTQQQAKELEADAQTRIEEDKAREQERIGEQEDFGKTQADIIKEKDKGISDTQQEVQDLAQSRLDRDVKDLQEEQKLAAKVANSALELQKQKDEEAIFFAEREVEINKQKSAWAFNKLGLSFSSGVILQAQEIATSGAVRIATLKVQANFNQAKLQLEAQKIQSDYTKQTNGIIDKYTDIQLKNKQDIINRIDDTNNNLLLNNEQRTAEINKLKDEYVATKRKTEDSLKSEQERLADRATIQAEKLEATLKAEQNEGKANAEIRINTGEISRMTASQVVSLERELGLPGGTLLARESEKINATVRNMYDSIVGKDYPLNNVNDVISDVRQQLKQGKNMSEAISFAVSNDLQSNPEILRREKVKRREEAAKLSLIEAQASKAKAAASGAGSSSGYTIAERDAFLAAGGKTSDLKNLQKTGGIKAATEALKKGGEETRAKNKTLQEGAKKTVKKFASDLGTFEDNTEAEAALGTAYSELQTAGFSDSEIIEQLKKHSGGDLITETKNGVTTLYNNSKKPENVIGTITE